MNEESDKLSDYPASLEDFTNEKYSEVYAEACDYEEQHELTIKISERLILKLLETKQTKFLDQLNHVAKYAAGGRGALDFLSTFYSTSKKKLFHQFFGLN